MTSSGNPIIVVGLIVLGIAIFVGIYLRNREMTFEGEVIDKNITEHQTQNNNQGVTFSTGNQVTHTYNIRVKTTSGKEIHYPISSGLYEVIKIGDKVSKPKGTTTVSIVTPASTQTTPVQPPGTLT